MKKLLMLLIITLLGFSFQAKSQVFNPQMQGHYGTRILYFEYGYYRGKVKNGIADGIGTFYFNNGTFYRGGFLNGWKHGKGVIVSPYYGYLAGCWSKGNYSGDCLSNNKYYRSDVVKDIISEVQDEKPNDSKYLAISPEDYKIKIIDFDSHMGKKLLGKYSGN